MEFPGLLPRYRFCLRATTFVCVLIACLAVRLMRTYVLVRPLLVLDPGPALTTNVTGFIFLKGVRIFSLDRRGTDFVQN